MLISDARCYATAQCEPTPPIACSQTDVSDITHSTTMPILLSFKTPHLVNLQHIVGLNGCHPLTYLLHIGRASAFFNPLLSAPGCKTPKRRCMARNAGSLLVGAQDRVFLGLRIASFRLQTRLAPQSLQFFWPPAELCPLRTMFTLAQRVQW